jgi:hypothetical protein
MLGAKGQPILPTEGLEPAFVERYRAASEALLERALTSPGPR